MTAAAACFDRLNTEINCNSNKVAFAIVQSNEDFLEHWSKRKYQLSYRQSQLFTVRCLKWKKCYEDFDRVALTVTIIQNCKHHILKVQKYRKIAIQQGFW